MYVASFNVYILSSICTLRPLCYHSLTFSRLAHLKSYTIPFLDAGKFLQAQCDLFGSFVNDENAYVVAAAEALSLIKIKQTALDNDLSLASMTLESSVFTLMPVFSLFILIVGGCFFATDRQRLRLADFWKHLVNSWNRLIHRNRVYDFGSGEGFDSSVRLDVQGDSRFDIPIACMFRSKSSPHRSSAGKASDRLFEKSATLFICIFCVLLLVNAIVLHAVAVPSIIMAGDIFSDFELAMEFLADQSSPQLFLAQMYAYTTLGIYGLQCNASNHFFDIAKLRWIWFSK
jgi:hypothetical protein